MKLIAYVILGLLVSCGQINNEVKVKTYRSLHKIMPNPQLLHDVEVKAKQLHSIGQKILKGKLSVALATEYNELLTEVATDFERVKFDFWWARGQIHKQQDKKRKQHYNLYLRNSRKHLDEWLKEVKYTFVFDIEDVIVNLQDAAGSGHHNKINPYDKEKLTALLSEIRLSGHNAREQINNMTTPSNGMVETAAKLVAFTKKLAVLTKELAALTEKREHKND